MSATRREPTVGVLLRSKWIIATIVGVITIGTGLFSVAQPPVYIATATLVVNQPQGDAASFDVVQATQAYARTLSQLIGSRNVADQVAQDLDNGITATQIQQVTSFNPVTETQLIEVKAEDRIPGRAAQIANAYADTFVSYVKGNLAEAAPTSGISLADRAVTPGAPARPKPTLYTLVAFVLSLAASIGGVLVFARLDNRIRDVDVLVDIFDLPVLGVVPRGGSDASSERRIQESVRLLCTTLQHTPGRPLSSFAITSCREGEGKSTVAAELAEAYATLSLVDRAVLAVDADLRRSSLVARMGLDASIGKKRGLSTYLRGGMDALACISDTPLDSLRILPAGPMPDHPATLLGLASSAEALQRLKLEAATLIFDTPPLSVGADATIIAAQVDAVLLVVDLSKTTEPELRQRIEQLTRIGVSPLGFVVNRSDVRERSSSYYVPDVPEPTKKPRRFGGKPVPVEGPAARG